MLSDLVRRGQTPFNPPDFVDVKFATGFNGASPVKPTGLQVGDLLLGFVMFGSPSAAGTLTSAPPGFFEEGATPGAPSGANDITGYVHTKLATGSEPSNYPWVVAGSSIYTMACVAAYRSPYPLDVVDVVVGMHSSAQTSVVAPSVTPNGAMRQIVMLAHKLITFNTDTLSIPSGVNNRGSIDNSGQATRLVDFEHAPSTATPTKTFVGNASFNVPVGALTVALRPNV